MLWRIDPELTECRAHPTWAKFHRLCGAANLAFDRFEREGRRGKFSVVAVTTKKNSTGGYNSYHLADGKGATPLLALQDAYQKCGVEVAGADALIAEMLGTPAVPAAEIDPFEELFA